MDLTGGVDFFRPFEATGWVADRDALDTSLAVDIRRNGRKIARIPASGFRADLRAAGMGDGKKAFWFNPFDFLERGANHFRVEFAGTKQLIQNGATTLVHDPRDPARAPASELSKTRWGGAEPDTGLTWGRPMNGDTFLDAVVQHTGWTRFADKRVIEIGPGYGRLLKTLRQRNSGYESYVGLDLSADRVERLTRELGDEKTRFVRGDAMSTVVGSGFDLLLCSATFEHFYPSCAPALANIKRQMSPDAFLCIDFKQDEPDMLFSGAFFESQGGAFVRVYSRWELERTFTRCGFAVEGLSSIALGTGETGAVIQRIFVCARPVTTSATVGGWAAKVARNLFHRSEA